MAEKFNLAGLKAEYLTSKNSKDRDKIEINSRKSSIIYLFVVDIFYEGVDIPNRYRFISSSNRKFNCVSSTIGERFAL
jgi:superfamily II DNA or RNA helicase